MPVLLPHTSMEFKENEIKTLEFICTRYFFEDDFNELATALSTAKMQYQGFRKKGFDFNFTANFEMEIEERAHQVVLHASLVGNYDLTSYSIGVCEEGDSKELIRRFHFDYIHKNSGTKQKVPVSHLQYGGKCNNGFLTNKIAHWLSEPRFNFPPINLALLLDLVFCEFSSEKTKKITEDPRWRDLILKNELLLYKHYYKTISDHIGTTRHTKDNLVRDFCYA